MKTITLNGVVVGNGTYDATVEVNDTVYDVLAQQGLLRVFQGSPSGKAEKSLAYPGEAKRPEKFNRKSIPYSPEFVKAFTEAFEAAEIEIGRDEKDNAIKQKVAESIVVEFSEYTGATGVEPKYKAEKDLLKAYLFEADGVTVRSLKSGEPRTAASFAASRGLEVPTEPWDEDTEFLKSVKEWVRAQAEVE